MISTISAEKNDHITIFKINKKIDVIIFVLCPGGLLVIEIIIIPIAAGINNNLFVNVDISITLFNKCKNPNIATKKPKIPIVKIPNTEPQNKLIFLVFFFLKIKS
ncbi:hypothetical protein NWQ33_02435 [Mycoplasmopsis cynos]|nr:hypothetical protein [Mycoplasmopsis cynos]